MTYPATFEVETPAKIANWRPLVQWILAIPHLIIVEVLEAVSFAVAVISWFSIVFTGRVSAGLMSFQAMMMRYSNRTTAYVGFLHDTYPPFDFTSSAADPGGTPVTVDYEPDLGDRNRLTVGLRFLWMIPIVLFLLVVGIAAVVVWFLNIFIVLFTGSWNEGMRDFVVRVMRLGVKVEAYVLLLTDEYPPFSLD